MCLAGQNANRAIVVSTLDFRSTTILPTAIHEIKGSGNGLCATAANHEKQGGRENDGDWCVAEACIKRRCNG
jgi:hypothetical protein